MSKQFTAFYSNKVIQDIKDGVLNSYDEVYATLKHVFHEEFRSRGLADMCWRMREVYLPFAEIHRLVYKYDYRFSSYNKWQELTDLKKEKVVPVLEKFEKETCILCGVKYGVQFPKILEEDGESFMGPFVTFLPAISCGEGVIAMENFIGERIYFSLNKTFPDYNVRIKDWRQDHTYALPKLISAINDRRIKLSPYGDILLKYAGGITL